MKLATALFQAIVLLSITATFYSQSPGGNMQTKPTGVGDAAPDFTLADQNGNEIMLSAVRGKSPVVLVFYRGYW